MRVPVLLLFSLLFSASCHEEPWVSEIPLTDECQLYDGWSRAAWLRAVPGTIARVPDSLQTSAQLCIQINDTLRYIACNLPAQAQKIGKMVIFNADELVRPANTQLAGVPIRLTRLRNM